MTKLEEFVEIAKEDAKGIIESGEYHQPIILALHPEGMSIILVAEITNNIKAMFKSVIATMLRLLDVYAYVFINEAWVVSTEPDSFLAKKILSGEKTISELPLDDKTEALSVVVVENGKSYTGWLAKIRYTPEGKRYLDKWQKADRVLDGLLVLKEW